MFAAHSRHNSVFWAPVVDRIFVVIYEAGPIALVEGMVVIGHSTAPQLEPAIFVPVAMDAFDERQRFVHAALEVEFLIVVVYPIIIIVSLGVNWIDV